MHNTYNTYQHPTIIIMDSTLRKRSWNWNIVNKTVAGPHSGSKGVRDLNSLRVAYFSAWLSCKGAAGHSQRFCLSGRLRTTQHVYLLLAKGSEPLAGSQASFFSLLLPAALFLLPALHLPGRYARHEGRGIAWDSLAARVGTASFQ